ncbi:MAG: hypothetical protein ACK5Y2_10610 [Bdellovibrionales bacterium]
MLVKIVAFVLLGTLMMYSTSFAQPQVVGVQPSVSRRAIVCDSWQWIGNGAVTWGCMSTPRETSVAHGLTADQVIFSLQEQINQLEARIKALEKR